MTRNASGSLTLQAIEGKECVCIMRDDVSNAFATPSVMATTSGDVMSDVFSSSCDVGRNSICGVGKGLTLKLRVLSHVLQQSLTFQNVNLCCLLHIPNRNSNHAYFSFQINAHKFPNFSGEHNECIAQIAWCKCVFYVDFYGLFPLLDSNSDFDSDTESCTMQDFSIGSESDFDLLIEIYVIGDGDLSLKWVQ